MPHATGQHTRQIGSLWSTLVAAAAVLLLQLLLVLLVLPWHQQQLANVVQQQLKRADQIDFVDSIDVLQMCLEIWTWNSILSAIWNRVSVERHRGKARRYPYSCGSAPGKWHGNYEGRRGATCGIAIWATKKSNSALGAINQAVGRAWPNVFVLMMPVTWSRSWPTATTTEEAVDGQAGNVARCKLRKYGQSQRSSDRNCA